MMMEHMVIIIMVQDGFLRATAYML